MGKNAKATNLYIKITTLMDNKAVRKFLGDAKLIKSTFRAIFRTAAVVAAFLIFRKIFETISRITEKVKELISQNIKLQFTAQQAAAVMTGGGKETLKNFQGVVDASRQLAIETGTSANKIAEGLYKGALAGLQLKKNISVVKATLEMATIAGTDFRTSMSGVIGVTRAFEVNTKQIGHYADVMTKAFATANMTFTDFITSMKYVAPIATVAFGSTKDTFIDTAAGIMSLTNAGLDASKSGVYLRGTFLKLMGSSNKVTSALAKYGVNLYEGKGKAREYMNTMIAGQKAMSKYYDEVTRLKSRQFELLLSGKEGTAQYKKVTQALGAARDKLSEYSAGLKMVNEQFRMAGGTLKAPHKIVEELKEKIPHAAEVMTKLLGVRGGAGIARLLNDPNFPKLVKQLNEVWKESEKGKSILHDIFVTMLKTVGIRLMQIKNAFLSIFSVIAQSGLRAIEPVLNIILNGVKNIYTIIRDNKDVFDILFKNVVDSYLPEIRDFFTKELPNLVKKVNVLSPKWSAPLYESVLNKKTGKYEATKVRELTGDTITDRLIALMKSLSSYFVASAVSIFRNHKEDFVNLGKWIGGGLVEILKIQSAFFIKIGAMIGQGVIHYMIDNAPVMGKAAFIKREIKSTESKIAQQERYKKMAEGGGITNEDLLQYGMMAGVNKEFIASKYNPKELESLKKRLGILKEMYKHTTEGYLPGNLFKYRGKTIAPHTYSKALGVNIGVGNTNSEEDKAVKKGYWPALKIKKDFAVLNGYLCEIETYLEKINGKWKWVGERTVREIRKMDETSTSLK